ncbi:MAG: nicotinate phosphoribosyltransferase [Chloroflexota bacterium]
MTIFNGSRLTNETFKLDIERMRRGWYSDKYFENITAMLEGVAVVGDWPIPTYARDVSETLDDLRLGDIEVELQLFTRRPGKTLVVGIDKALTMLRYCTGFWSGDEYVERWQGLDVEAVHDGSVVEYDGNPRRIRPVMRVRGRYRDFALLETPMLGILGRASRIATNVYHTLRAARGKPVLFFPARFDVHEVQAADGYAYDIAVQRYAADMGERPGSFVSTDAQGEWWGGHGGGTVAHAAISCFLGDISSAMLAFARFIPAEVPRIALVDFENDSVLDSLRTLKAMFDMYRKAVDQGDADEAAKYVLFGVRLDTAGSLRDVNVPPLGKAELDLGVVPRLVFAVRESMDSAWKNWDLPAEWQDRAREYCEATKIVVTGGFDPVKIRRFELLGVPVDIYGVGSSLMSNDKNAATNTDFTADVVRVKISGNWVDMAKVGRSRGENPELEQVDLGQF